MKSIFIAGGLVVLGMVGFSIHHILSNRSNKEEKETTEKSEEKMIEGKQCSFFDEGYVESLNCRQFDKVGDYIVYDIGVNKVQKFVTVKYRINLISNDYTYENKEYIRNKLGFLWDKSKNQWCKEYVQYEEFKKALRCLHAISVRYTAILELGSI